MLLTTPLLYFVSRIALTLLPQKSKGRYINIIFNYISEDYMLSIRYSVIISAHITHRTSVFFLNNLFLFQRTDKQNIHSITNTPTLMKNHLSLSFSGYLST